MAHGDVDLRLWNTLIAGCAGSGKSHTISALMDEDPPSLRQSTPCSQKPVRAVAQLKFEINESRFRRVTESDFADMIACSAESAQVREHKHTQSQKSKSRRSSTIPSATKDSQQAEMSPSPPKPEDKSQSVEKSDLQTPHLKTRTHMGTELFYRFKTPTKKRKKLGERDLVNMTDSGGQPQFLEVLPIFVHNTQLGMFTVKLNESLDDYPWIEYYIDDKRACDPFKSAFTHKEILNRCMKVVQSQSSTSKEGCSPKIVFIGTHRDQEHLCSESREAKNQKINEMLLPETKKNVIFCDGTFQELIFALNVKTPNEDDKQRLHQIRKVMIKEMKVPKVRVPLQWFALDITLHRLSKTTKNGVLSKAECFAEASVFHFTWESFESALQYLHSHKLIFYYGEILPNVVFVDSQVILDKITEIIVYSFKLYQTEEAVVGDWEKVKHGIITRDLLERFSRHYVPGLFTSTELIELFKHLLIFAQIGDNTYLMSCLLYPGKLPQSVPDPAIHSVTPLLLYFADGGPKLGVFCLSISYLITEANWKLLTEGGYPVDISRNSVHFEVPGNYPGQVIITDPFSTFFHISLEMPSSIDSDVISEVCSEILDNILSGVQKASRTLNYTNSHPKIAFSCNHSTECPVHPATLSRNCKILRCTTNPTKFCSSVSEEHQLWLAGANIGKPCTSYDLGSSSLHHLSHTATETKSTASAQATATSRVRQSPCKYMYIPSTNNYWTHASRLCILQHCTYFSPMFYFFSLITAYDPYSM